ncbi:MAG: hypothetical protein AAF587_07550 [Bacteroidota bacterium]
MTTISYSKIYTFILFFLVSFSAIQAQDYSFSVGARIGSERGLTIKHVYDSPIATEGMLVHHKDGIHLIGLAEYQFSLGRHSDSYLFFGLGGHVGYQDLLSESKSPVPMAGVDGILGFEYVFPNAPLVFSIDMKPQLELLGGIQPSGNHAAVTLRYILN